MQMEEIKEAIGFFPNLDGRKIGEVIDRTKLAVEHLIGEPPTEDDYLEQCADEPTLDEYTRSLNFRALMEPTDWLVPIIWIFVFAMSVVHMLTLSGELATSTYHPASANFQGIWISQLDYTQIHQIAFFFFSELGIIFFYTRWRLNTYSHWALRLVNLNIWFAIFCTIVVLWANIAALAENGSNGLGIFIGFLISAITIGLGERISELVREWIEVRQEQKDRYEEDWREWDFCRNASKQEWRADLDKYYGYRQDPESHPKWRSLLAREVIAFYRRSKVGKQFEDWNPYVERMLAAREIARMGEVGDIDSMIGFFTQSTPSKPTQELQPQHDLSNVLKPNQPSSMSELTRNLQLQALHNDSD